MNTAAEPILDCYVPFAVERISGLLWVQFHSDGTFASYKKMPNAVKYLGTVCAKKGWNSDTCTISYGEQAVAYKV